MSQASSTGNEFRLLEQKCEEVINVLQTVAVELNISQRDSAALLKNLLQTQQDSVALLTASQKDHAAAIKTLLSQQAPTVSQAVAQLARVDPRTEYPRSSSFAACYCEELVAKRP